jgi:hypothetical protein
MSDSARLTHRRVTLPRHVCTCYRCAAAIRVGDLVAVATDGRPYCGPTCARAAAGPPARAAARANGAALRRAAAPLRTVAGV